MGTEWFLRDQCFATYLRILERIGNARFTCHADESLTHVLVTIATDAVEPERFGFQGNVGNTGNFGWGVGWNDPSGGEGFDGKMGFVVEISGMLAHPDLETKMAKAEDIIGRYRNTLKVLAK